MTALCEFGCEIADHDAQRICMRDCDRCNPVGACRVASLTTKRLFAAALLLFALNVSAREEPCTPPGNARSPCVPPATYKLKSEATHPQPLDAPTKFGGERNTKGRIEWLWLKAGPASKPCTAAQLTDKRGGQAFACAVKDGEVLYITSPFREVP